MHHQLLSPKGVKLVIIGLIVINVISTWYFITTQAQNNAKIASLEQTIQDITTTSSKQDIQQEILSKLKNIEKEELSKKYAEGFTKVYKEKRWGPEGNGSGPGSSKEGAKLMLPILKSIFEKYHPSTFLDAVSSLLYNVDLISHTMYLALWWTGLDS
jgi:hypothetical protein